MTRELSEAHKKKLAAGREKAAKAKAKVEDKAAKLWLDWMKEDSRLYAEKVQSESFFGHDSKEACAASRAYQKHHVQQPPIPKNDAIKRVRGEAA